MDGLGKYTVIPVDPHIKANLERTLQSREPLTEPRWACPHEVTIPGYMRKSNGTYLAQSACLKCRQRDDIRPARGDSRYIFDICVRDNLRGQAEGSHPCARCGAFNGVERQHWAPQAIFDDAWSWPTSWLCVGCHRLWHQAMRDAKGVSLPPDQRRRLPGAPKGLIP